MPLKWGTKIQFEIIEMKMLLELNGEYTRNFFLINNCFAWFEKRIVENYKNQTEFGVSWFKYFRFAENF